MKHIYKGILMVAAAAISITSLTACLDESPRGQLTQEQASSTKNMLLQSNVATLYNYIGGSAESQGLQGTYRGVYDLNTFTTDEAMLPTRGNDWYDGGLWQNLYRHTWTESDKLLLDTWNYLYKVIMLTNQSLEQLSSHAALLSTDEQQLYNAEVRSLRAMFYFYAMDLYGRVPLVTGSTEQTSATLSLSERSEVFGFIVDELTAALPYLIDARSNTEGTYYGRITRPVAIFLLAKLMLNAPIYMDDRWTDGNALDGRTITFSIDGRSMNCYEACVHYCDQLRSYGYMLEPVYASNFAVHNETSSENIFTIPMDKMLYANQFANLFRSRHYVHGSAIGFDAENGSCATLSTIQTYGYGTDSIDSRYAVNFYSDTLQVNGSVVTLPSGQPLVYQPLAVTSLNLTGSEHEQTAGARMAKYEIDATAYADGKLQDNDIVLFRYADVLLMEAEALTRNGQDGSASFDLVRQRVGMNTRPCTLDNILSERLMELQWEGWRRNDLIRFGRYHKAYDLREQLVMESSAYTMVFPIPAVVRQLNPGFSQNPGY